jgi:hypothetical protein
VEGYAESLGTEAAGGGVPEKWEEGKEGVDVNRSTAW